MVRRGSTVRVRQRALQKRRTPALSQLADALLATDRDDLVVPVKACCTRYCPSFPDAPTTQTLCRVTDDRRPACATYAECACGVV
jgi:hypothetical protein